MRTKFIILPLLLMLLAAQAAPVAVIAAPAAALSAAAPFSLKVVGQIGGVSTVSAVDGALLYANVGPRVFVTTATGTPALPPTYSPVLPGVPQDLQVAAGKVYVALGAGGIAVLDASTLAVLAQVSTPSPALALAVGSQRLYVAAGGAGILAYTLAPLGLSQTQPTGAYINDVVVHNLGGAGEDLFASSGGVPGSVYRFDITTSPVLTTPAKTNSLPSVNALAVTDTRVYAVGFDAFFTLDSANLGAGAGISQSVALAVSAAQVTLDAAESTAYVAAQGDGVQVVDIRTNTPVLGSLVPTVGLANSIAVSPLDVGDFYLFIADGRGGLSIAEATVADPRTVSFTAPSYLPAQPAYTSLAAGTDVRAFAFSNAAPANPPELVTVDTTVPAALSLVGAPVPLSAPNVSAMVVVTDTSLILSAGANVIVNYPIVAGQLGVPTAVDNADPQFDIAYKTVVSGTTALVADGPNGLATVDLNAMHVTGRFASAAASDYVNIALAGDFAYVIDLMDDGTVLTPTLRVYDIGGATPTAVGAITIDAVCGAGINAADLQAWGTQVYVACGANGIRVVNASNPAAPALDMASSATTPGPAQGLALQAPYLYVAEGATGVGVFTLGSTGKLTNPWTTRLSDSALSVAVSANGNVYVATQSAGLEVLQPSPLTLTFLPVIVR